MGKKRGHRSPSTSSGSGDSKPSKKRRSSSKSTRNASKQYLKMKSKMKRMRKKEMKALEKIVAPKETPTDMMIDNDSEEMMIGPDPKLMQSHSMKPMSKEEWEKQQSVIRHVYDPETGRQRLIKGDGEVLEEIVTHEQNKEINKKATIGDGACFQARLQLTN